MSNADHVDARAVEAAVKAAVKTAHAIDPTRQTGDLIRQAHYDRSRAGSSPRPMLGSGCSRAAHFVGGAR